MLSVEFEVSFSQCDCRTKQKLQLATNSLHSENCIPIYRVFPYAANTVTPAVGNYEIRVTREHDLQPKAGKKALSHRKAFFRLMTLALSGLDYVVG